MTPRTSATTRALHQRRWPRAVSLVTVVSLFAAFACTNSNDASPPGSTAPGGAVAAAPIPADVRTGDAPNGMWSGRVPGTDAFVAIVSSPVEVMAYVCDFGTMAEWFRKDAPDKSLELTSPQGVRLRADLSGGTNGKATGTVTFPGKDPITFEAAPSTDPVLRRADARTAEGNALAGWINIGEEQRGATSFTIGTKLPTTTVGSASSTTTTRASTTTTTAPTLSRIVVAAPPINSTVSLVSLTTTTTKPSTTTTAAVATPITVPITPPTLVRIIVPSGITTKTGNRPLNYVIAAGGDSYGSGEGAPLKNLPFDSNFEPVLPIPKGSWGPEDDTDDQKQSREACHRSLNAGAPVAVLGKPAGSGTQFQGLAQKYPGIPIRFIHVACSGAEVNAMLNDGYVGADRSIKPPNGGERAQLKQITDFVGVGPNARFDSLIMSIGGNNSGFGAVVGGCIKGGILDYLQQAFTAVTGVQVPITLRVNQDGGHSDLVIGNTVVPIPDELRGVVDFNPSCDRDEALAKVIKNGGPDQPDSVKGTRGFDNLAAQYDALGNAIRTMIVPPSQTLITEYPDPSRQFANESSPPCSGPTGKQQFDLLGLVDQNETPFTIATLLNPLNRAVVDAAGRNGWDFVRDHVDEFRRGHGVCATSPFVNDNNAGLQLQGDDFDGTEIRAGLQKVQAFLRSPTMDLIVAAVIAAGLLTLSPATVTAGIGMYVLAHGQGQELEKLLSISAGIMHPNASGYESYAKAILPKLEQQFITTMTPEDPGNFRQAGGAEHQSVVLRWDDLSDVETQYRLKAERISGNGPASLTQTLGPDTTEFTHTIGVDGTYKYTLQACNPQFCSAEVTTIGSSSKPAAAPTGLKATFFPQLTRPSDGVSIPPEEVVQWNGADNATNWNLESTQVTPTPTTTQPKVLNVTTPAARIVIGTSTSQFPSGHYKYRVQACNIFGCGPFSAAIEVDTIATTTNTADFANIEKLLPPSMFVDAGIRITIPTGPSLPSGPDATSPSSIPGPGPGPDPTSPG